MNALQEKYLEFFNAIDFKQITDHPNILIAARFWDDRRYAAARTFYKFMREVDDLIDNHKAANKVILPEEKQKFNLYVENWLNRILDDKEESSGHRELKDTIRIFRIPSWPLEAFARSMIYDIYNDGFPDLNTFLDYAGGASVAPAAIFVHLAGLRELDHKYSAPSFNVKEAASTCAIFSYLVHIIRDFQKDQLNNLNYFADDLIKKHGLTRGDLSDIARGGSINSGFRGLMQEYYVLADEYRQKTYDCIRAIWPYLEPRYQLSLEIIFGLYLMVFERIDVKRGNFTTEELNPLPDETREKVYSTIKNSRSVGALVI